MSIENEVSFLELPGQGITWPIPSLTPAAAAASHSGAGGERGERESKALSHYLLCVLNLFSLGFGIVIPDFSPSQTLTAMRS